MARIHDGVAGRQLIVTSEEMQREVLLARGSVRAVGAWERTLARVQTEMTPEVSVTAECRVGAVWALEDRPGRVTECL